MIKPLFILTACMFSLSTISSEGQEPKAAPAYVNEAPLPKGWPTPGPYNVVSEKNFPAYRAAYTEGAWRNFAFMRLFKHIKREGIPMTAPVEMDMEQQKDEKLKMKSMGFMYQTPEVGKTGKDGEKVEVRDIPALKALSYTWQGKNNAANRKIASDALKAEMKKRDVVGTDFKILGYNGPGVADAQKTWEMILVLPTK